MKTPLGWARANMMYDLLDKPPKTGSVLEALCLMVQMRRQIIRLYGMHTVVQAVRASEDDSGEAVQESFSRYRDSVLPFLKEEVDREHKNLVRALKEEAARGPMMVRRIAGDNMQSRLRKKLKDKPLKPPKPKRWKGTTRW